MFGPEPVDKVHGGDEARFGGRTADVREVGVGIGGVERADYAAMERDFRGEVGEVEVAWGVPSALSGFFSGLGEGEGGEGEGEGEEEFTGGGWLAGGMVVHFQAGR